MPEPRSFWPTGERASNTVVRGWPSEPGSSPMVSHGTRGLSSINDRRCRTLPSGSSPTSSSWVKETSGQLMVSVTGRGAERGHLRHRFEGPTASACAHQELPARSFLRGQASTDRSRGGSCPPGGARGCVRRRGARQPQLQDHRRSRQGRRRALRRAHRATRDASPKFPEGR